MWYCDASFLVSAFGKDRNTPAARQWLGSVSDWPLIVSRLTLLEFETALRAAVKGGGLQNADFQKAQLKLNRAVAEGYVKRVELAPKQWFPQAQRITTHASIPGTARALDVLHVAAAMLARQKGFLSFDSQQRELAESEGLQVMP